jgi:hypothetical protein
MKYLEIQKLAEISAFLTNLCNGDQVLNGSIEAFSCKATGNDKKFAKRLQKQLSGSVDVEKNENIQTVSATTTTTTTTKNNANGNNQNSIGTNQSNSITNDTNLSMLPSTSSTITTITTNNNSNSNSQNIDMSLLKPTPLRSRSVSFAQSGAYSVPGQELSALGSKPLSMGPLTDPYVRKRIVNLIATMNATFQDYDFSTVKPERFVRHQSYKDIMPVINKNFAEVVEIHNRGFLKILWDALDDAINVRECEVFSYIVDDEDPKAVTGDLWSINYFFFNSSMNRMAYLKCIANSKFRKNYDDMMEEEDSDYDDEYGMGGDPLNDSQQFYQVTEMVDDDQEMDGVY